MVKGFIVAGDGLEGYFTEVRARLIDAPNLLMFLVDGEITPQYGKAWYVRIEPRIPKIYWGAPMPFLLSFFLPPWGFYLFVGIGVLMLSTAVFWSRYLYAFVVWLALRKKGLKGVFVFRGVVGDVARSDINLLEE